jgi:hypothetical protein
MRPKEVIQRSGPQSQFTDRLLKDTRHISISKRQFRDRRPKAISHRSSKESNSFVRACEKDNGCHYSNDLLSNLLPDSLFWPEGFDLMYDDNAGGNHHRDVRDERRTVADELLRKLRTGDAHQIYVCAKSQFTDPPRKDLGRKKADADRQEQWPRRYQDGATKGVTGNAVERKEDDTELTQPM